jgi:hypothetical protein
MDLMELRYLEGTAALKARIKVLSGRSPNALQVAFASSCLLHGRLFWDSAKSAPLETKPLLLYYGAAAFAKALIVATGTKQQDLSQSHGLTCATGDGERIANFTIKARGFGLFQEFNDVVAPLNGFRYFEETMTRTRVYPTAVSSGLSGLNVTLDDCLARIPDLARVYQLSTGAEAKTLPLSFMDEFDGQATHTIRVDVPELYDDERGLRDVVSLVRSKVPFLQQWRVKEASKNWDNTIVVFDNYQPFDNEHYILATQSGAYITQLHNYQTFDALDSLPPLTGGDGGRPSYMQPIQGQYLSEHSVMMAALLGLSSLVRYHPHTWTACVYRRQVSDRQIDDTLLPVIEEFLAVVEAKLPRFIAEALLRTPV